MKAFGKKSLSSFVSIGFYMYAMINTFVLIGIFLIKANIIKKPNFFTIYGLEDWSYAVLLILVVLLDVVVACIIGKLFNNFSKNLIFENKNYILMRNAGILNILKYCFSRNDLFKIDINLKNHVFDIGFNMNSLLIGIWFLLFAFLFEKAILEKKLNSELI